MEAPRYLGSTPEKRVGVVQEIKTGDKDLLRRRTFSGRHQADAASRQLEFHCGYPLVALR
jgi:hypothetical protein